MLFRRGPKKPERWPVIQIEVTSRCLLHCSFCPNKTIGSHWIHGDLPWELYRDHIAPHLDRFDLVYLQGWGEPMLHPRLFDMIGLAKAAGCRTGFTTCGGLLDDERVATLLELGLDILSVSFAGAGPAVHESLRHGSSFERLAQNVARVASGRAREWGPKTSGAEIVVSGKARAGSENSHKRGQREGQDEETSPLRLELHFLMTRRNIGDLPAFVRLAASLGADEVVATNLTYAPDSQVAAWQIFGPEPEPAHLAIIQEASAEARQLNLGFRSYPLIPEDAVLECDARPTETVYVNHCGEITPCVYLGMPVQDFAPRLFEGQEHPIRPVSFGNVRTGLIEALQGRDRASFCAPFRARRQSAIAALAFLSSGGQDMVLPAPPEPCRHCYKLQGL